MSQNAAAPAATRATGLRCQHLVDPLGIDGRPVFAWVPEGGGQTAFQLLVASDEQQLVAGVGDLWDSGRVESTTVTGVAYAGAPLASRTRAFWTVRLWDADGHGGELGPTAQFELGLLEPGDWQARWVGADVGVSSPLLRHAFTLDAPVRRARAYVSALGYGELRLNGHKVGDRQLDPPQTSYDHDPELLDGEGRATRITSPRVLYTTYDVTSLLQEGDNAVGLILGHGWYSAEADLGPGPLPRKPWGEGPRGLVQLEVELQDDTTVVLASDDGWRCTAGPVRYNDYAHGERHDARLAHDGWDRAGFADGAWAPAQTFDAPRAAVRAQQLEPIRVVETLAPVGTSTTVSGATIADFGQHVSGWTRVTVSGPAGAEVTLTHAGEIDADGDLDDDANMGAWLPARQTDTFVLAGTGVEVYEPRFTLHGFRYVEIATTTAEVQVARVEARVVHSDLRPIGDFACSDELLERIHRNVLWSHRASFQGFPQDAAERNERVGWVGDPGWAIEDYLFNFDAVAFWLKWLEDLADAQLPDGRFPVICPIQWRGGIDMAPPDDYELPEDLDTMVYWPYGAWVDFSGTSHPAVTWELYAYTGDRSILERHYPVMRRGLEFLRSLADGLIVRQGLGDHQEPQPDGTSEVFAQRTPVELTSTAWFFRIATIVADTAELLGEVDDARAYRTLATEIAAVFNARFFDAATTSYATGSQTSRALPLWFGIVEEDQRERVLDGLVEQIRERDNGHLWTGTMGTAALQQVLAAGGHADVMYEIATQTTFPGWGHQVVQGATTVWETWGGDAGFSRNMKLMASIEKFLYQDVAGLAPAAPGWERIVVRPRLTETLTHARASVRTVRGVARVEWRVANGVLTLEAEVPASSTAEVWLPGAEEPVQVGAGVHRLQVTAARA